MRGQSGTKTRQRNIVQGVASLQFSLQNHRLQLRLGAYRAFSSPKKTPVMRVLCNDIF